MHIRRYPVASFSTVLLGGLLLVSCSQSSGSDASVAQSTHLDQHVQQIFADVEIQDSHQFDADQQRVRDLHAIAALIERYFDETGYYPLRSDGDTSIRNVVIGANQADQGREDSAYVTEADFVAELRSVLGESVSLPSDPLRGSNQARSYVYSAMGRGYTTACMLYHPVGWSEGIYTNGFQYRLGSRESDLPILEARKLFAGGYPVNQPAKYRDPSMGR